MEKTIEQALAEGDAQVVAEIDGREVTRAELAKAFDRVVPLEDWKKTIDAYVVVTRDGEQELIAKAIEFFTGSKATFEVVRQGRYYVSYRVRAAGYFATIGA